MYIASSTKAMMAWIWQAMFLIGYKPSWLWCRILRCSPNVVSREVRVLVKSLYMVQANAIGS